MSTPWLLTVREEQPSLFEGPQWAFWTLPPRDRTTRAVRRRGAGGPFTPALSAGDEVFVHELPTGRIVAQLSVHGLRWDNADELFKVDSTVEVADVGGPTLADIGVARAVQGGRQRLTTQQRDAAVEGLMRARSFTQQVEAAAMKAVEKWRGEHWSVS